MLGSFMIVYEIETLIPLKNSDDAINFNKGKTADFRQASIQFR